MQNNIFGGVGSVNTQVTALDKTNFRSLTPGFIDRANYELHPTDSLVLNSGSTPGVSASGLSLLPTSQYKHVANGDGRPTVGQIDIGAYEAVSTTTDTVPPVVSFAAPTNGTKVRKSFKVSVTATDNIGVAYTSLYLDGNLVASVAGGALTTTLSTSGALGTHTLTATATDAANNKASSSITVTYVH